MKYFVASFDAELWGTLFYRGLDLEGNVLGHPEYLKEAFAGESQANRKYLAFAKKADQEGHP